MAIKLHRPDAEAVRQARNLTVLTPVKKQKGQRYLEPQDQWLSTAVSRVRQPIEALFAWIEEKTALSAPVKCAPLIMGLGCRYWANSRQPVFLEFSTNQLLIHNIVLFRPSS
jgi:hypothetical protein